MDIIIAIFGLIVFFLLAIGLSENRSAISWRLVGWGVSLQVVFALIILKTRLGYVLFHYANAMMTGLLNFANQGSFFLFGELSQDPAIGALLAFQILPVIIFVSSLMCLLYYLKIIPMLVRLFSSIMRYTMKATGLEALSASLFIFMGIEAVTAMKHYINNMTRSELFVLMTGFMSTIAGSTMAIYVSFGAEAGHLLSASVMSAPAAIVIAKIMVPDTLNNKIGAGLKQVSIDQPYTHPIEAISDGASEGAKIVIQIAALLLSFVALISLLNYPLNLIGLSFEGILGWVFTPIAWLMGVPWKEASLVGELIGIKIVFTEFLSFARFQEIVPQGLLSTQSLIVSTYALCGFTSFVSIGIIIGAIASVAPSRKDDVITLGFKALFAAMLTNVITATIAGILL